MNPEDALKHPWILELKKKSSKEGGIGGSSSSRPKHRIRRDVDTSVEHENTMSMFPATATENSTLNEYHFQKQLNNIIQNAIDDHYDRGGGGVGPDDDNKTTKSTATTATSNNLNTTTTTTAKNISSFFPPLN